LPSDKDTKLLCKSKFNWYYKYVSDRVDVDNFALYYIAQIYFNNTDWPGNNIKFWKSDGGKWRWILYDTDFGFGTWDVLDYEYDALSFALEEDGPDWPNPAWSTLLFRKLIENKTFRNKFINRFADELNSRFLSNKVKKHIQETFDVISSENNTHYNRWGGSYDSNNLLNMKVFADKRPSYCKYFIKEKFNIPNIRRLTILNEDIDKGFVEINNNLKIQSSYWGGDYFENIPVTLKAVAKLGFEFSHWSGSSESNNVEIELNMLTALSVKANFIESSITVKPIVINEINYKSGDIINAGDWIELYNPNNAFLDISNWVFKDSKDDNVFIIPEGTSIASNSFLVITKNKADFTSAFPDVKNFIGNFNFGLSSNEDAVRIFNNELELQDEVQYKATNPWPTCANGKGPTLELKLPNLDNSLPENWDCLSVYGTPGTVNDATTGIDDLEKSKIILYPNPIINYMYIKGLSSKAQISIFDLDGQKLLDKYIDEKIYLVNFKPGVYLVRINTKDKIYNYKIIKE